MCCGYLVRCGDVYLSAVTFRYPIHFEYYNLFKWVAFFSRGQKLSLGGVFLEGPKFISAGFVPLRRFIDVKPLLLGFGRFFDVKQGMHCFL